MNSFTPLQTFMVIVSIIGIILAMTAATIVLVMGNVGI